MSFLQKTQANVNPIEFLQQILLMLISFVFVSLFCELGELISEQYEKVDLQLFECKWYRFPIQIQRELVIVIANVQQPVYIYGYGNVLCTRDTLKEVRLYWVEILKQIARKIHQNFYVDFNCR